MTRLGWFAAALVALALGAAGPPPTPMVDHSETLFGITLNDPYNWMEQGGPAFEDWLSAQAAYTRAELDRIPARAALLEELRRLNSSETVIGDVVAVGAAVFFTRTEPDSTVARLWVRAGGDDRMLVDPTRFDVGAAHAVIDYWRVAPDGRHVAYGVSVGGVETGTLRIVDVQSGRDLPEQMDRTRFASPSWSDNETFYYTRLPPPPPGGRQSLTGVQVFRHRLGADPANDLLVFGPGAVPGVTVPPSVFSAVTASAASRYIVGSYDTGLGASDQTVFVARPDGEGVPVWRRVATEEDRIRGTALRGDWLYLRTARDAPQQKIIRVPLQDPNLARAETVLPPGRGVLSGMAAARDALYVRMLDEGLGQLVRIPWDGGPIEQPELPYEGAIMSISANPDIDGIVVRLQGWLDSPGVFEFDPVAGRFVDAGIGSPSSVSFADAAWRHIRVPAPDGAEVPMAVIYLPRPGSGPRPVLLFAYGAYNYALEPNFNRMRRAWLDRGGGVAIAHVRGSGGFGEDWHRGGRREQKVNSITDFIACAEYIVGQGWTTPAMLGAQGGSAGAIVVGGAVVQRPDLFSAALIHVGLVNMVRLEHIPIGPFNTGEFGSTATEEGTRMLLAIDVFQQVRDHVAYPGVLLSTGRNDPRIPSWMPAKLAARLQAATTGPRPVLLRVEHEGGHFGGSRGQLEEETADNYAFLLWQAGVKDYQPGQ